MLEATLPTLPPPRSARVECWNGIHPSKCPIASPPASQSPNVCPRADQSTIDNPPVSQASIVCPPADQSTIDNPPVSQSPMAYPPAHQSAIDNPPVDQSATWTARQGFSMSFPMANPPTERQSTMFVSIHMCILSPPAERQSTMFASIHNYIVSFAISHQ